MSVSLKWSSLSPEWQDVIRKDLQFVSKNTFKFSKDQEPTVLHAYNLDLATDTLYLPYFFANNIFKRKINFQRKYLSCNFTSQIKLHDYQEVIYAEAMAHLKEFLMMN